jgi:hypothetical protein
MFTSKGFLQIGGAILLLVGILGYVGVIGPTAAQSPFGEAWYFDNAENLAHTVLGIVGIAASFVLGAGMQRTLVMLLGVVGILVAVYNIFSSTLLGAALQNPADLLLHAVVGAWALYASRS